MQYANQSLKPYSTFAIENTVQSLQIFDNLAELSTALKQLPDTFYILGGGSNTIFIEDFHGTLICPQLKGINIEESQTHYLLHVQSGENWHELVQYCLVNDMPGLENLALIPGNCGAAPIQNIGAYGVEFADVCEYVDWLEIATGKVIRLNKQHCQFGYRDSVFKGDLKDKGIIVAVGIKLPKQWQPVLSYQGLKQLPMPVTPQHVFDEVVRIRQSKLPDPKQLPNTGSFFKNPVVEHATYVCIKQQYPDIPAYQQADGRIKLAAGWLIDQCNLKGKQIGGAAVHVKQALVLINKSNASGQDVIKLARFVQEQVFAKFTVQLQPEVRFIGTMGEMQLHEFP
ncbi:UDP-N-acetylmuramate dehydrogenase [Thalassotalea maritima]|uniref:UDP-N-acetylmuramate dehydrogenase n=1 Tax=Thalassotalea maritima TaxID=3242416 RepID=UPI003528A5FD